MGAGISNLPPPTFINDADGLNPNLILADMVAADGSQDPGSETRQGQAT